MLVADIPATTVAVKPIKRILPVRSCLSQYQRRVPCASLRKRSPRVPLHHPTIFSLNKNLYNVKNNRKKNNFTTQVVAKNKNKKVSKKKTEISNEEKLLPGLRRVWWRRELPKAEDMKRKAEKERRKNDGFALKHTIMAFAFASLRFNFLRMENSLVSRR
jgi:hypothetical protein